MSNVYIALQANDEAQPIIEAILEDNPQATLLRYPAMVKIECPQEIRVLRDSVSRRIGREWDTQELHLSVISIAGNVYESDDEFTLQWGKSK